MSLSLEHRQVTEEESLTGTELGSNNPNIIPPEDVKLFQEEIGVCIGQRLKRGRYGVVYEGLFTELFSVEKLRAMTKLHYLYVKLDEKLADNVGVGKKFALKFSDIEKRKAYCIEDIEERVNQEVNFVRRVMYTEKNASVRIFFILATTPTRYYFLMELAENNLQCLISEYSKDNKQLDSLFVIDLYCCLVETIRALHQQKLTYGMMRTSNILIFYNSKDKRDSGTGQNPKEPFRVKIADFVRSVDMESTEIPLSIIDDSIEQDLDDLFYIHYEIFALTRFNFSKYQAFKESLKVMTDINAHQNSIITLDKVLELIEKFKQEQRNRSSIGSANSN